MERAFDEPDLDGPAKALVQGEGSGPAWPNSIARLVAAQIRYWRERRGLSAKQLSDRTNDLGYHVQRSVIANLENNRRDTIGVAELLVLAAALDIPPTMLITAVGREQSVEILPGIAVSPWLARGWLIGAVDLAYGTFSNTEWQDGRRAMVLFDVHRLLVKEHQQLETRMKRLESQRLAPEEASAEELTSTSSLYETLAAEFAYSVDRIRTHRGRMQKEGVLPPDLPPGLAGILRETRPGGRHHQFSGGDDGIGARS